MSDDKARRLILKRRARFVGVALAGAGVATSLEACKEPQPCLSVEHVDPSATPTPCLSPPPMEVDAGPETADAGDDAAATAEDAGRDAGTPPRLRPSVCLSVRGPPDKSEPKK